MAKTYSGGVVIATGFKLNDAQPIADYMVVDLVADLVDLPYQYHGMKVFVKANENSYVKKLVGWVVDGGEQIDAYTKTESDDKFATKEELENIPTGGGGGLDVYLSNTADSVIPNYKTLSYSVDPTETELSAVVNNNEVLIGTFLYPSALNTTQIVGGAWSTHFFGKVSSATGISKIRTQYFLRAVNGTETNIVTILSAEINSTDYTEFSPNFSAGLINCNLTDRLGIRVYASTTHNANITVSTIVGDGMGMHFSSPLAFRHSQLRDKNEEANYQHVTTAEKTKLNTIAEGAQVNVIESVKLNGSALPVTSKSVDILARPTGYNGEFAEEFITATGTQTITLKKSTVTAISNAIDSTNIITLALPTPTTGFNQSILYFETGLTIPTINHPANTNVFGSFILASGTKFRLIYDQINMGGGTYRRLLTYDKI